MSSATVRGSLVKSALLVFVLAVVSTAHAAPPSWNFQPRKVGQAIVEGGWSLEYPLGEINASPEFSFSLQLVYLNNREARGLFGGQWFCPQLESSLIPKGAGFLLWTMPSGGQVGFKPQPKRNNEFASFDGQWRASRKGASCEISNDEGWKFSYSKGRLDWVQSPTGRVLEFLWSASLGFSVQISDPVSGARQVLLGLGLGDNKCANVLQVNGQNHQFGYIKDGTDDRLSGWVPPAGNPVRFLYLADSGILLRAETLDGKKVADTAEFACVFVPPFQGNRPSQEQSPKKNPKNYWLKSDPAFDYEYPADPKIKDRLVSDQVTAKSKTGLTLEVNQSAKRGVVTSKTGGAETKTYYYKAPGQKYDGKLRRVDVDGQLKVEYRYDRKSGLLTESLDANGISTFFEYPQNWKPARAPLMEPKPARISRGSRANPEVVAEFGYNDFGQVVVAKDAAGQLTRYDYSLRGELASVTGPDGTKTSFAYDAFGRRTSVAQGDIKESVEFDDAGRVKARVSPDGSRTAFSFNKQGQLASVARDGKAVVEFLHDAQGRIIGEKDPLGRIKKVERDIRGNLLSETAPNGSVTRYEYDQFNRRTAQIDGKGNKITFEYDPAGHLVKQTNPLGGILAWTYDEKGRLLERNNGEQVTKSAYDSNGRLASLDYGNGESIAYEYDKEGRLVSATTPDTRTDYFYDKLGRVEATHLRQADEETLLHFTYNPRSQRTGLMLAALVAETPTDGVHSGKEARYEPLQQTAYTYDSSGRMASITSNGQPVVTYAYDSFGRPAKKTFGNGMSAALSYDAAGRLARVSFSGGPVGGPLDLAYQWDPASQLTCRTWNGHTQFYTYDPSGQLLKVTDPSAHEETNGTKGDSNTVSREDAKNAKGANPAGNSKFPIPNSKLLESYTYDKAGNMTEKAINGEKTTMTYDAANQLSTSTVASASLPMRPVSPASFTYDKAGRLLTSPGGPARTYGWLDKVTKLKTPTGESLRLTYWPDGQLAAKRFLTTENTESTEKSLKRVSNPPSTISNQRSTSNETFLWDGLALLRRNETIYIIEPHPSGGVPIASHPVNKPDELTYYLNDMLGTTLATVEGNATHFASLTAFGQPLKLNAEIPKPTNLSGTTTPNPVPQTETIPKTPR